MTGAPSRAKNCQSFPELNIRGQQIPRTLTQNCIPSRTHIFSCPYNSRILYVEFQPRGYQSVGGGFVWGKGESFLKVLIELCASIYTSIFLLFY